MTSIVNVRGVRAAAIKAGFIVAPALRRLGLQRITARARRFLVRHSGDHYWIQDAPVRGREAPVHEALASADLACLTPFHPFQFALYAEALGPGMAVVDCGAHIGVYTLLAARQVGPEGHVVALEPDEVNLRALRANLNANGLADRVEVIDAAASDRSGPARFFSAGTGFGGLEGASTALGSLSPVRGAVPTRVRCLTLDAALAGRSIDLAKIDVEGAETLVLRGMHETLTRSPGATVFIECHQPGLDGANPIEWLATLRSTGSLELIDERRRRLVPASDEAIAQLASELGRGWPFNVRWTLAG
jgi:FkbM family methyltransferase